MILHLKVVFNIKKIIILLIIAVFFLCGCSNNQQIEQSTTTQNAKPVKSDCVKSVWFTYYELSEMIKGKSEFEFATEIDAAFKKVSDMGFNTVTVQVRPFADAFYKSAYFPTSEYIVAKQGDAIDFDPLAVMCETAKLYKLGIEAWINPYRVSSKNDVNTLCDNNIAKKWFKSKEKKSNVYTCKKGIYFNPASDDVTELIANGVREIAENYGITAIHFDDYFYPSTVKKIDAKEFKENAGNMSLADFRRDRVSNMIKTVYSTVKAANKDVKFGISPAADVNNDYNTLYADVQKWASEKGYCDYICPQVYFGFRNAYQPFMFTVKKWISFTNCDLYIGLPLYKAGKVDKYAALNDDSIKNEFVNCDNIIARQITYLLKLDDVDGFYIFSYGSLNEERCQREVENMLKAMQ
ncbi:MAG: family 10 glycosylhydrolase [Eubacterium sp.]|nr:family 10 glycosylhydrolase [Eubacterium sp.]